MSSQDDAQILCFFGPGILLMSVAMGGLAYLAWFRPNVYAKLGWRLYQWRRAQNDFLFGPDSSWGEGAFYYSAFYLWLGRIGWTLGFVLFLAGFVGFLPDIVTQAWPQFWESLSSPDSPFLSPLPK